MAQGLAPRRRTGVLVGSGVGEALGLAGLAAEEAGEVRALLVALGAVDLMALKALGLEDLGASLGLASGDIAVRDRLAAQREQRQHPVSTRPSPQPLKPAEQGARRISGIHHRRRLLCHRCVRVRQLAAR